MNSFDSTKLNLFDILKDAGKGKIQLPDFQRGWVWDDNRIKGILASVAKSFPIGAVMFLETGNDAVRFKTKPIEGISLTVPIVPDRLILDGQQRITSLYQSIMLDLPVSTRNERGYELKRWYYIDMQKALLPEGDIEDAIFSIKEDKKKTSDIGRVVDLDLASSEKEYQNLMFPVSALRSASQWRAGYSRFWNYDGPKTQFWDLFEDKIIQQFNTYMLPVIILSKENPKEAVCQVFEKVNTGGVALNVFELLTATYAVDEFDLKQDWETTKRELHASPVLQKASSTDIIQAITLVATYHRRLDQAATGAAPDSLRAIGCKRKDMLDLSLENYKAYKQVVIEGFKKAAKILMEAHIYSARDLPYTTQLIPMAAILAELGNDIESLGKKQKVLQWFWCGVFGELYGAANETRYALDLPQVLEFVREGTGTPNTIYGANFSPSRLHTLRTRNSAAYKGVYALLLADGTQDWITATRIDFATYTSESIDIHHVFPEHWCKNHGIEPSRYNSIVNKTPLSGRTNRIVSGDAPSEYLPRITANAGVDRTQFDAILRTHVLDEALLYADDFEGFMEDRKARILERISAAMGKEIATVSDAAEEGIFNDDEDEEESA
jgi:hypothetical protein